MSVTNTYVFYFLIIIGAFGLVWISETYREKHLVVRFSCFNYYVDFLSIALLIMAYALLLVPLATRNCGTDTPQYYKTYVADDTSGLDFFFYLLCKTMHAVIRDPKTGLGIISAITLLIMFFSIIRIRTIVDVRYSFLFFFTGIYYYLYNYMRIMLALSFVMLGFSFIVEHKPKKAIAFLCAAVLFHRSAVLVTVIYIGTLILRRHVKLIILFGGIAVGMIMLRPMALLGLVSIERYSALIDYTHASIGIGTTIRILPFLFLLYYYKRWVKEPVYIAALCFTLANLGFSFLGYYVNSASRVSNMYFIFHALCFLPWLIIKESDFRRRACLKLFCVVYCGFTFYQLSDNFVAMGIIPYR